MNHTAMRSSLRAAYHLTNPTAKPPALLERLTAVQHWRE